MNGERYKKLKAVLDLKFPDVKSSEVERHQV
jgi:hypothetical protein